MDPIIRNGQIESRELNDTFVEMITKEAKQMKPKPVKTTTLTFSIVQGHKNSAANYQRNQ